MKLDAHQHFWHYSPIDHNWMSDEMSALKRDYLPEELEPLLRFINFDGCIAVQARQNLAETEWLLSLADRHDFIKGVVGWVDMRSEELPAQLARFAKHPRLVGVRHVVHDEPDDNFLLLQEFQRGLSQLAEYGLTYDLLLFPKHLPVAVRLLEEFPDQPFVLDHIAKPLIADGILSPWREDLKQLAKFPNVCCKLSGMVTEARWNQWKPDDFQRYIEVVFNAFGPDRVMIGSDWPVCTLAADYKSAMSIVMNYVQQFPADVQAGVLGENCARFYGIAARR
jgi:L-fuconolactonase